MKTYNLKETKRSAAPELGPLVGKVMERVDVMELAKKLDLFTKLNLQQTGKSFQGDCPTGHQSSSHMCFSLDPEQRVYHCFSCNEGGNVMQLVKLVRNVGRMEATRWLIEEFAPELKPDLDGIVDNMTEEDKLKYRRAFLYGKVYEYGHELLFQASGKPALDYLVYDRKYDPNLLLQTQFMSWNPAADWKKWLHQQYSSLKNEIDELPLSGGISDQCKVALPFRDYDGVILGFVIRHHTPAGLPIPGSNATRRWTSTTGLKKEALFGLNRLNKTETVVALEGYADAEYFRALGMTNVVALGTVALSDENVESLVAKGIGRVILSLDRDVSSKAGLENTLAASRKLAGTPIRLWVVDPDRLGPHKDPDELVRASGLPAFQALVDSAEPAASWLPKQLLGTKPQTVTPQWDEAVSSVIRYAASLADPGDAVLVVDALRNTYGMSEFELSERLESEQQKAHEQTIADELKDLADRVKQMSSAGEPEKALQMLDREGNRLMVDFRQGVMEKPVPLTDFLTEKQGADAMRQSGVQLGYQLKEFPQIADAMDGVQPGLILVGADPNTGKTMLLVNLAIHLLRSNDKANVLFYTLDDSRNTIVNRFLAKLAQIEINKVQTHQDDKANQSTLDVAYKWMADMAKGRLDILELSDGLTMNAIREKVRSNPKRKDTIILIDGVYNIPLEGSHDSIREENIARANGLKGIAKAFNIPLIGTAELRKRTQEEANKRQRTLHDLMESVKYAYNADVILLLTPTDEMEKFRTQSEPFVDLTFEKNKLSGYRDTIRLTFRKAVATFEQGGGTTTGPVLATGGGQ